MPFDYNSFIAGVQVGRRLKVWDADRSPSVITTDAILTEDGIDLDTESGEVLVTES